MKARPCRAKQAGQNDTPCTYSAMKGKQSCEWHWLAKQPADVQRKYAEQRLQQARDAEAAGTTGASFYRQRVPSSEWPPGERWCSGCQSFVPLFYTTGSRCKSCASSAAHGQRVEKTYGITSERYDELFEQQGRRCAVCRNRPRTQRLAVDHDHKTGEPRGLLCKRCNHDLLGGGHDDPELLYRALAYLLFPSAKYPTRPTTDQVMTELKRRRALAMFRRSELVALAGPPDEPGF